MKQDLKKIRSGYKFIISNVDIREKGMQFIQTILRENFPSYPLPLQLHQKQVLLQLNSNKIFNFRQFQMELIG